MADKVLFYRISKADYQNILNKDGNSVYWITDEGKIYLGDRLQAEEGPVKSINGKTGDIIPEIDDINNLTLTISGIQVAATNLSNLLSLQTTSLSSSISTLDTTVAGHETDISALQSQQSTNNNDISTIKGKIPTQATTANQLADKAFVNSSIGSLSANYVTYNATGDGFPTKAALTNASKFYYGGAEYTPTKSDYCLVIADESAPYPFTNGQTRYVMANNMWAYQYGVNETPFTAAQNAALNSGITSAIVSEIDDKLDKEFTPADVGKLLEVQSNGMVGLTESDTIERNTNKKTFITNDTTEEFYPTVKSIYDSYGQTFSAINTITDYINRLYPVGTIYLTIDTAFDPNSRFVGVWTKTGEGKVPIGAGTFTPVDDSSRTFVVGETQNGKYSHTLIENEMPSHNHYMGSNTTAGTTTQAPSLSTSNNSVTNNAVYTASTGGGSPHNNVQPYFVIIFWKRDS
jgi:hypothetical protein